jgi:serine/threonine-protein kinase
MHPERVGPYLIEQKIGAGGMGNVYLGRHETTNQPAAVKVLPASMAREDGFVQRFTREIDSLRKVSNRHIVQLFQDGVTDDETLYYAMEFVDGPTLTTLITDRHRLPWKEVIELSLQIAAALKAAHDAGIVHRDLKPSNLMLTNDRVLKLTDFGVASLFASSRLTRVGGVVGTAEYMSPEQARGQRATPRSDLYSLGAVMYAMLTGRPPFTGATANDILHKHQFAQFDRPSRYVPDIPPLLEDLVCQLLDKDPSKRLPDAFVVMKRLEQIRGRLEFAERQMESETTARSASGAGSSGAAGNDAGLVPPGTATVVRNLVREEVAARRVRSPLAQFFDNTFVLLTLLGLIVVFGIWMNRRTAPDIDQQLNEARKSLTGRPGPGWIRTRDEVLVPLLESPSTTSNRGEIRRLIAKVNQYEFCRSLQSDRAIGFRIDQELERLIRQSFDLWHSGQPAAARDHLQAVLAIVQTDPANEYLTEFMIETLGGWQQQPEGLGRRDLLERLLEKASREPEDGDARTRMIESLRAVIALYSNDAELTDVVEHARRRLAELEQRPAVPPATATGTP